MSARVENKKDEAGNSSSRRYLGEIERVSKYLNIHRKSVDYTAAPTHHGSNSNAITGGLLHKDKTSIWKKPWRALSHIRYRRFDCWFFLHVHSIEGLPSEFNDTNIRVYWKRKNQEMRTRPAKISQGKAQFEETLMHRCSVYGSKKKHQNSAKYEPKVFLLYALVVEATIVDMGNHQIDLTKLLPLTLEELSDKRCSGKWTSSFKLSGRAKGGVLNVSFGFSARHDNLLESGNCSIIPKILRENVRADAVEVARDSESGRLRRVESSGSNSNRGMLIKSQSLGRNHFMEIKSNITDAAGDVFRDSGGDRLQWVKNSTSTSKRILIVQSKSFDSKLVNGIVTNSRSELARSIRNASIDRSIKSSCEDVENFNVDTDYVVTKQGIETSSKVPLISEDADVTSGIETIDVKVILEDDGMAAGENKRCKMSDKISSGYKDHAATGDNKREGNYVKAITKDNETVADGWMGFNPTGGTCQVNDIRAKVLMLEDSNIQIIDVNEIFKDDEIAVHRDLVFNSMEGNYSNSEDHPVCKLTKYDENYISTKELTIPKIDLGSHNLLVSKLRDHESLQEINEFDDNTCADNKPGKISRSLSLDDITDSVANDFLKGLSFEKTPLDQGADTDPESPRGLLLKQFEEEALASGDFILNYDSEQENVGIGDDDLQLSLVIRANDKVDGINSFAQSLRIKKDAELLEYTETEALMREWGFNEDVFQKSPGSSSGGFGSPVYLPVEEALEFPPLGEGLGSTVRTKDGGFLRSMNPLLFRNAKNGGKLIMQVSAPVVLPAAMGSSIMEILQLWASVGYEKMSIQVDEIMPLEDISGKMLQQVAWEIASRSEATQRLPYLQKESEDGHGFVSSRSKVNETPFSWGGEDTTSAFLCDGMDIDYVSFEGLAPLAMHKVETMSIEGLRVQSGMAGEEAPSVIEPQLLGKTSVFLGNRVMAYGSSVMEDNDESEAKDEADEVDELISLSLKLDDWMRLDSGVWDDEDEMSERTSKILEAHLSESMEFDCPTLFQDKLTGKSCGFLGNNFTIALRVQLRDPLRDYETVGSSMISLVEVERVFLDPKPIIRCRVSERDDNEGNFATFDQIRKETNAEEKPTIAEEVTPLFKITEVHVAGFRIETVKKQNEGAVSQEHSGFRWLVASGIGEIKKLIHLKTNAIVRSHSQGARVTQHKDTLWSISSHVHSPGAKWKELATMKGHIRNPDVVFFK